MNGTQRNHKKRKLSSNKLLAASGGDTNLLIYSANGNKSGVPTLTTATQHGARILSIAMR